MKCKTNADICVQMKFKWSARNEHCHGFIILSVYDEWMNEWASVYAYCALPQSKESECTYVLMSFNWFALRRLFICISFRPKMSTTYYRMNVYERHKTPVHNAVQSVKCYSNNEPYSLLYISKYIHVTCNAYIVHGVQCAYMHVTV